MSRNPFLEMLTAPEQEIPGTFWATVTATNPLRVKRDAEPVLPVTPQTLANLAVGDRVLCLWERRQVVVLGRIGGGIQNLSTENLNDITRSGLYRQVSNANTSSARNYPVNYAGLLEVFEASNMIWQRYTIYNTNYSDSAGVYNRRKYLNTWYDWEELRGTDDGNTIWINGNPYAASGITTNIPSYSWSASEPPIYRTSIQVPVPYTPPSGYSFNWYVMRGTGAWIFVSTVTPVIIDGTQNVRVMQVGSSGTSNLTQLGWQLVKI